jgi:photosystem II stability/assembly factor-like uncharacterized protein
MRSDASGRQLQKVFSPPNISGTVHIIFDCAIDPGNPRRLYLLVRDFDQVCQSGFCATSVSAAVVWRSVDGGDRWTSQQVTSGAASFISAGNGNRIFAFSPQDGGMAFVTRVDDAVKLFRSTDAGETWSQQDMPGVDSTAWPFALSYDPQQPDTLYYGNLRLFRSKDGGATWTSLNAPHADQTVIAFDAQNRLLSGNDGGIYRADASSTFASGAWKSLNSGLPITEFYKISAHPRSPTLIAAGAQDNGTSLFTGRTTWSKSSGGDGGRPIFIATAWPSVALYTETQWSEGFYAFFRCNSTACTQSRGQGLSLSDRAPFIPEVAIDPVDPNTLILTTERLYRTETAGDSWSEIAPSVRPISRCESANRCAQAQFFTTVAIAPSNRNVVYAGTTNGEIRVSRSAGTDWTSAGRDLPFRWVTDIEVDPGDANRAYVTFSGAIAASVGRKGRVFRTGDGGSSWQDITGNLPDIATSTISIDSSATPRQLYAGTDIGVFRTTEDSGKWDWMNNGLPAVPVVDLVIGGDTETLLAATYGRGVYMLRLVGR